MQDGIRALGMLVEELDGFFCWQHQQFDLATLGFDQDLFHHSGFRIQELQTDITFPFWVAQYFSHRSALRGSSFQNDL